MTTTVRADQLVVGDVLPDSPDGTVRGGKVAAVRTPAEGVIEVVCTDHSRMAFTADCEVTVLRLVSDANAPKFHDITTTGDGHGNAVSVTRLDNGETLTPLPGNRFLTFEDVNEDPRCLGDAPEWIDGVCSFCKNTSHVLDGVKVSARAAHRFDRSEEGGYYTDELLENQR